MAADGLVMIRTLGLVLLGAAALAAGPLPCPPSLLGVGPRREPPATLTTQPGLPGSIDRLEPPPEGCAERFPLATR